MYDKGNPTPYRNPNYIIPQLFILGGTEFIVCFGSLCYSLYFYKTENGSSKKAVSKYLKYMNLFGILSFLMCNISQCINIYYWNEYMQYSFMQAISWVLVWFFWSCGTFISYLLFLNRITITFKQSAFKPTQLTIRYLYSLLCIYAILWIVAGFLPIFVYFRGGFKVSLDKVLKVEFMLTIPISVFDFLISSSMIYIFVSRLYKLILMQTSMRYVEQLDNIQQMISSSHEPSSSSSSELAVSLLLTNQSTQLIKISVKISILTVTSLSSSLILITLRSWAVFVDYQLSVAKVFAIWLQIDTIISCLCLVLFLPKTQKGFDIFCCCCNAMLSKYMKKKIHKSTIKNKESVSITNPNLQ